MNCSKSLAPSPQQALDSQGVLRISGCSFKFCYNFSFYYFCYVCNFLFLFNNFCCYSYLFLLLILSGDVEPNPGPNNNGNKCRILYHNIRGLHKNINDLQIISRNYDIILCSETLVSNYRNVSEILLPGFTKPTLLRRDSRPRVRGLATYIRSGFSATIKKNHICNCHEIQLIRVCSRSNNFYIFSIYRNPDLDDSIYDCLLSSMSDIQEQDRKSSFIFVGDLNAHHQEWLNSTSATDRHGIAALDFANLSGCVQLINEPTHQLGNCLDLLLTDVPGVVDSVVKPPLGGSDHSCISFSLKLRFIIPNVSLSRKVYLKSRVDWPRVNSDLLNINWSQIYNSPNPAVELNNTLGSIIDRRVPTKIIRSRPSDKAWFNVDCINALNEKQSAYRLWTRNKSRLLWDNYVQHRRHAESVYNVARNEYNNVIRESLSTASQPRKWWSTLKTFLFGVDSSLPPIRSEDGSVTSDPSKMAEVFSSVFQRKQSDQILDLPPTCFPLPKFTCFAFKSIEVKQYLKDLDSQGGSDPNNIFPLFLKETADLLAPKLAKIFRDLMRSGSFPESWRTANVTPIPKGSSPTQFPLDYRPISITPIISKIYEKLISRRLYKYADSNNFLPQTQFGFRKGLGTTDALLMLTQDIQSSLDKRAESRVVSLDFSSAFDLVNHQALLYKLKLMGVGGPVFNILQEFLSSRKQRVSVDGKFSQLKPVVSGVPQGSVLGPLLFILFTADMWNNLENKIISYADDTTLYAEINSPSDRSLVAESLNRDLSNIQSWCSTWGMKLNPSKTHSIIVSRSRTPLPLHPPLLLCGVVLEVSNSLELLGVTLDNKLTFEKHIRNMANSIAQKTGLIRKCYKALGNSDSVLKSFYAFILPCFEYCSPVWGSASDSHLRLLDRAFNNIRFFLPDLTLDLEKRRNLACLAMLYKILHNTDHPLHSKLPQFAMPTRITRQTVRQNDRTFVLSRCNTTQYSRCFVNSSIKIWNDLPNDIVLADNQTRFKTLSKKFFV